MTLRQKKLFYLFIGGAISILFLWGLFSNIDIDKLTSALVGANYWWLLPNIALIVFTMYQRAYRWQFMMKPIKHVAYGKLLAATCIGFMANNVLPLRLGEFVRAYSIARQERGVTKSASLATIFVERMVLDLVALLVIFGLVVWSAQLILDQNFKIGLVTAIITALVGIIFMLTLALKPVGAGRLLARYIPFLPALIRGKIEHTVVKFSRGFEFIRHRSAFSSVLIQTALIWVIMGLSNYFVFMAFGFDLPVAASFVLLVTVSLAILIPSSPGFIGVYHFAATITLSTYGIPSESALSFALVLHAAQYIPITLLGFYFLRKHHLSLKSLEEQATRDIPE